MNIKINDSSVIQDKFGHQKSFCAERLFEVWPWLSLGWVEGQISVGLLVSQAINFALIVFVTKMLVVIT